MGLINQAPTEEKPYKKKGLAPYLNVPYLKKKGACSLSQEKSSLSPFCCPFFILFQDLFYSIHRNVASGENKSNLFALQPLFYL